MEEKVLIQSKQYNLAKAFIGIVVFSIMLTVFLFSLPYSDNIDSYDDSYLQYLKHQADGACYSYEDDTCIDCEFIESNPSKTTYAITATLKKDVLFYILGIGMVPVLVGGLICLWLRSYKLTVTDKRIYGQVAWGKRVDLPIDSVSSTSTVRIFDGVTVSTSSGRISFRAIKNSAEIYTVINNLLIERQKEKVIVADTTATKNDETEQLKKYKELLDSGIINQEEYDAKKKQLLGL